MHTSLPPRWILNFKQARLWCKLWKRVFPIIIRCHQCCCLFFFFETKVTYFLTHGPLYVSSIGCPTNLILHNKDNLFSYVNLSVFPILVQCLLPHCRGGKFVINTVYFSCLVKFELVYLCNPPSNAVNSLQYISYWVTNQTCS